MTDDRPGRADDRLFGESSAVDGQRIITDVGDKVHDLNEGWLRSRVRGWLELVESPNLAYWVGCYTPEGRWIFCSSERDHWAPKSYRQEYAMRVCRHVNKQASHGGAWLVGWIRGGREFYLCWKDNQGDIQIPIECDKPFVALMHFTDFDWENHCNHAFSVYSEQQRALELTKSQQVNVAQGQKTSPQHLSSAPRIALP